MDESTIEEKGVIEDQIKSLKPLQTLIDGKVCQVRFELNFTMIDGKMYNKVTGTKSAMRCYICNVTSQQLNNLQAMRELKVNESKLVYRLSTLRSWIIFFECLLHIGYKLKSEKWLARGVDKKVVETQKKRDSKSIR